MFEQMTEAERRAFSGSLRVADRARLRTLLQRSLIHELRSPLNALTVWVDLLGRFLGRDGDPAREDRWHQMEHLEAVREQLGRLAEQLPGLLPLAEPDEGRPETIDVVETLPRLMVLLHQRWRTTPSIHLCRDLPDHAVPVVSIDSGVEHAFLSITMNALEAMPNGGTLKLGIRHTEGELLWEVEDEGPGIPEALGESIFEPYISTKEGHPGLGLFVAREMIREHDGTLLVTTRETGGTRVEVRLPAVELVPPSPPKEVTACRTPS